MNGIQVLFAVLAVMWVVVGVISSLTFVGGTVQQVLIDGFAGVVFALLCVGSKKKADC